MLRQRELEQSNADRLFDDASPAPTTQQPQVFQQPTYQQQPEYQQLGQVDLFGNPMGQQNTGYLANVYSQPTGYPQQQYAQPTVFDQSGQMPYMVAQPTGYVANPYIAPSLSPQQTQQQSFLLPGDNNPYANNHQAAQPLQPLPTGSNNPFAPKINNFSNQPQSTGMPLSLHQQQQEQQRQQQEQQQRQQQEQQRQQQLLQHQEQQRQQQLFQNQSYQQSFAPSSPISALSKPPINPQHAHLEGLLAAGNASGLDTFGNVGDLRIPAQHTAPGMFVNSAGTSRTGRPMAGQPTGNNPFFNQQLTGVPQQSGFGGSLGPGPNRLMPAHTGPAGLNGFGGYQQQQAMANPYVGFGQQQQPQQQQNGNLIDL